MRLWEGARLPSLLYNPEIRLSEHFDSGVGTLCLRMLRMGLPAYVCSGF